MATELNTLGIDLDAQATHVFLFPQMRTLRTLGGEPPCVSRPVDDPVFAQDIVRRFQNRGSIPPLARVVLCSLNLTWLPTQVRHAAGQSTKVDPLAVW